MTNDRITVEVSRKLLERADDMDLTAFLDSVYEAVVRNFSLFNADEKYHVCPEEVHLTSVIIHNYTKRSYYRAKITTDTEGTVILSNIERVKKQWVPFGETIERSEGGEIKAEFAPIEMRARNGFWGAIL